MEDRIGGISYFCEGIIKSIYRSDETTGAILRKKWDYHPKVLFTQEIKNRHRVKWKYWFMMTRHVKEPVQAI